MSRPSMSAYVLSFLDSMRQRTSKILCKGEACLPRSHNKEEPLSQKSYAKNSHNVCPPMYAYVLTFFMARWPSG